MVGEKTLTDFLTELEIDGKSENTIRSYQNTIHQFLNFTGPESIEESNCCEIIQKYKIHLKRDKKYKNSSLRTSTTIIKRYLEYTGHNCQNVTLPKLGKQLPKYLSEEDIRKLLSAPEGLYEIRDKSILRLLYASGLRVSELTGLNKDDILFDEGILKVNNGKGSKDRQVYFDQGTGQLLKKMIYKRSRKGRVNKSPALFTNRYGNRLSTRSVQKMVKSAGYSAGIKQKVTPHILRHSFAAHYLTKSNDIKAVQQLLGHESLNTTQIYTEISNNDLKKRYNEVKLIN